MDFIFPLPFIRWVMFVMSCLALPSFCIAAEYKSPLNVESELPLVHHKKREEVDRLEEEEFPKENGGRRSNGIGTNYRSDRNEERQPDVVDDHPGKSRSTFQSCHTSVISYAYHFF